jgi:hypothetical protein
MFGVVRPCACTLRDKEYRSLYQAHMCGMCVSMRKEFGPVARLGLNRDAVLLTLLFEHLSKDKDAVGRVPSSCVLRRQRRALVIDPECVAARYAGMISVTLAQIKSEDAIRDLDAGRRMASLFRPLVDHYARKARDLASEIGVDSQEIQDSVRHEVAVQMTRGRALDEYLAPIERAYGFAFGGVARLARAEGRVESAFAQLGRAFGGLTAIIDALEDFESDNRGGKFNVLSAESCGSATRAAISAQGAIKTRLELMKGALAGADLPPDSMISKLLVGSLDRRTEEAWTVFTKDSVIDAEGIQFPETRNVDHRHRRSTPILAILVVFGLVSLHDDDVVCCELDDPTFCCA